MSPKKMRMILVLVTFTFSLFTINGCFQPDMDTDQDGIEDGRDNCVDIGNSDQQDTDGDGYGDQCDNCPALTFMRFSDQRDSDGDGVGDICDNCINVANPEQLDTNGDAIGDACAQEADRHAYELLAKAAPDECFYGVGAENSYDPDGFDAQTCSLSGGIPKRNESYIWGMTKADNLLYFGTHANARCFNLNNAETYETDGLWVCEREEENNTNPVVEQDRRPPSMYAYDTQSGLLKKLSIRPEDVALQNETMGIRSAASHHGVVLMAGPTDGLQKQINFFAFNAETGEPLGAKQFPYVNIRQWLVVKDALYCGVSSLKGRGTLLKWTGSLDDPFQFETVGEHVGHDISYLTFHDGRIYVTTHFYGALTLLTPELTVDILRTNGETALWMSPKFDDELDADDANQWQKVWSILDYEPDNMCALLAGGAALASYDGWLYWSTMHIKNQAQIYSMSATGLRMNNAQKEYAQKGAYRAISVFRGKDLDTASKKIELLYGEEFLDAFVPRQGWKQVANKMNQKPKYGGSGLGNLANNYAWAMQVYKNKLYLGTMDEMGADLYCFPSAQSEALPVNVNGLGNIANFGIRTMVADEDYLYLGTANHFGLSSFSAEELIAANPVLSNFTDPAQLSGLDATGGWELIRIEAE